MQSICLLGASGSVGESSLKVIRRFPSEFNLHSCSIHSNLEKAKKIISEFHPSKLIVSSADVDKSILGNKYQDTEIYYGTEYLNEIVSEKTIDTVITAIVGSVGIVPTISAIKAKKKIAIANKETLVTFGPFIKKLLEENKVLLIPVDSEHNALFQLLETQDRNNIRSITLTASGGPFRSRAIETLNSVSVAEALNHPTWKMGPKISIDSASLVNKSLEVIEAHFLFGFSYDKIEVVIHPESIVHGIIETLDGATHLYASHPDMVFPVAHSLFYPRTTHSMLIERKPCTYKQLNFIEPDLRRYPALKLAYQCGRTGGTAPGIFNAANEVAVNLFLDGKIAFTEIPVCIQKTIDCIPITYPDSLEEFIEIDSLARKRAYQLYVS
jgi:1-deoxy-D-xylulose-5-phosphate reductoisomerase